MVLSSGLYGITIYTITYNLCTCYRGTTPQAEGVRTTLATTQIVIAAAIGMGADLVRIGFEDSKFIDPEARAENNLQLVDKLATLIRAMDREIATPDEARRILNVKPKP